MNPIDIWRREKAIESKAKAAAQQTLQRVRRRLKERTAAIERTKEK